LKLSLIRRTPMKVDTGTGTDPRLAQASALRAEELGYNCAWSAEVAHDPFLPVLLAARATKTIGVGTALAVAFARSPMTMASTAWDLNLLSSGRFSLGLGSQVKPHIERRFSMPWSLPAARMREYVLALHAIWDCWQYGTRLKFEGDFYTHTP
jgi:probable F420-dependent oxidoreductase